MTYLSLERTAAGSWAALEEQRLPCGTLRYSRGYRKRFNSLILGDLKRTPFEKVVDLSSEFYGLRSEPVLIRVPSFGTAARFDDYLQNSGFTAIARSRVMTCALSMRHETELPVTSSGKEEWLDRFYEICQEPPFHRQILSQLLDLIPGVVLYASLVTDDGEPACCALGVIHQHVLGTSDVVTAVTFRRQRYASRLINQILAWGRLQRAADALLQVEEKNHAALALYGKLGFRTSHWYWYRERTS